jgi:uncharacterized protein YyaL (SSP411 family)
MAHDTHSSKENPNSLIHESSPYLLQHAYNPVQWYPWGQEALEKAKKEDKPIIVSIGYSACHWCHVMERESFESTVVAQAMNNDYVCIKVDREERPDIDQIYMDALQTMNLRGGWPLNVFLTPDAKPFYGGTYFPPDHWLHLLGQISAGFKNSREDLEKSAQEFTNVLNYSEVEKYGLKSAASKFDIKDIHAIFSKLENTFDKKLGGGHKEPKFPMPSIYMFLLRYYKISENEAALQQIKLTLDKMAYGGIYDQIGGGFARYSTDAEWFAPHFEKMLYDNGQLVSLYSEAYALTKNPLYKQVVYETISWLNREMISTEGGFFSALDADSEGQEGKFYVWKKEEIDQTLKEEANLFCEYYNVKEEGNWEHEENILHRDLSDEAFANKHKLDKKELEQKVKGWKEALLHKREKRERPGLDDKILSSWNGLMLKGLADAYRIFDEPEFLKMALKNADFLTNRVRTGNKLFRSYKNGKTSIDGYLEDYAFVIEAYLALYQATFDEAWLNEAKKLTDYVMEHFFDPVEELFFFTDNNSEKLIARKKEVFDNVNPASNSTMATNLYWLGLLLDNNQYTSISSGMLSKVQYLLSVEPSYLSNWGCLFSYHVNPTVEIAIAGKDYLSFRKEIDKIYQPNKVMAGTKTESALPLLQGRHASDSKTMIFVCYEKTCKLPVDNVEAAVKLME